jgi:enoyl-CoA hydratase / 3-hydroxyacyl-CoA dehydrogenase
MFVDKAAVVGAGRMGTQIAQLIASSGIPVVLRDADAGALEAALVRISEITAGALEALVARGALDAQEAERELERTLGLLSATTGYEGFGDVELAIEAVPDRLELKQEVFAELDAATPGHAVLASATSALSIAEIAAACARPDRVLGLHFLHPVARTRVVEVVEALETAPESIATALSFLATLRRGAVRSQDTPGFVVNRVLFAAAGELWHAQREGDLDAAAMDQAIVASKASPIGAFALAEQLGAETTQALSERLQDAYGDRFHAPPQGLYPGSTDFDAAELASRWELRAFTECCLLLQEGIAGAREVDLGVSAGAGLRPPLQSADAHGLIETLAHLEHAAAQWGEAFAPPLVLARLIAQGRTGAAAGQGFFPTPAPDRGEEGPVKLETRGAVAIVWIENPPANSISFELIEGLERAWTTVSANERVGALVFASANPALFCAGADIKAFTAMDAATQSRFVKRMHALVNAMARSRIVTIAAVNGLAYGGGCELAMALDLRIAARSASFAQPEIRLGIIPGFGGTQRLARLIGEGRALELNLTGEPIDALEAWELGLVNRVAEDHELLDVALVWARRLAAQAPLAVAEIKRLASGADLDAGLAAEAQAFARVFASADAREGIAAFIGKRAPHFTGAE